MDFLQVMFLDETRLPPRIQYSEFKDLRCNCTQLYYEPRRRDLTYSNESVPVDRGERLNALQRLSGKACYSVFYVTQREYVLRYTLFASVRKKGGTFQANRRCKKLKGSAFTIRMIIQIFFAQLRIVRYTDLFSLLKYLRLLFFEMEEQVKYMQNLIENLHPTKGLTN